VLCIPLPNNTVFGVLWSPSNTLLGSLLLPYTLSVHLQVPVLPIRVHANAEVPFL
jgi:hypothetical protein